MLCDLSAVDEYPRMMLRRVKSYKIPLALPSPGYSHLSLIVYPADMVSNFLVDEDVVVTRWHRALECGFEDAGTSVFGSDICGVGDFEISYSVEGNDLSGF
jgi:hypothetical protein